MWMLEVISGRLEPVGEPRDIDFAARRVRKPLFDLARFSIYFSKSDAMLIELRKIIVIIRRKPVAHR